MKRQIWRRLGRVFCADGRSPFLGTHASYPTPLVQEDGTVRVFFSPRDGQNRSTIFFLDLAIDGDRFEVLRIADGPLLEPGPRGSFDDSGVTVSCVIADGDRRLVYYLGWSLAVTVPFRNFIGLAIGHGGEGLLRRLSPVPILDRSEIDPYTLGYPWVLRDGEGWRMWYGSHLEWGEKGLEMRHVIKEAASANGMSWRRSGRVAIALGGAPEFAVSRPCVMRDPDLFRMWYARRHPDYSIGYAESEDGHRWIRQDAAFALSGPTDDWDSDSATYPAVFDLRGTRYILYNGNGYGRSGFGLACLES
jgi:hypothetical protein